MTTNSKPTPGEWRAECVGSYGRHDNPADLYEITNGHTRIAEYVDARDAPLLAEAGTIYHETGLTPRQLAEQRAELLAALRPFAALLGWHHTDTPDDRPLFGINGAVFTAGDLRAAAASIARAEGKP